jgi:hypothetical protein
MNDRITIKGHDGTLSTMFVSMLVVLSFTYL